MQAVSAHIHTPERAAPDFSGEIRLSGLPDVRPVGSELTGQSIELDATAQLLVNTDKNFDLLLDNEQRILEYLSPYLEATSADFDITLKALESLSEHKTPDSLSTRLTDVAQEQLERVKQSLECRTAFLSDAVFSKTGEYPEMRYTNLALVVRQDNQTGNPTVGIEGAEHLIGFEFYGDKVDSKTKQFLARLALHIACACEVCPIPFTIGIHSWVNDYVNMNVEMADAVMAFIDSPDWHQSDFIEWWNRCSTLLGEEFNGFVEGVTEIVTGGSPDDIFLQVQHLIEHPEDTEATEEALSDFRDRAEEELACIALTHSSTYNNERIDADFLSELHNWRDDAHCNHTSVVDALIFITELCLEHLPAERADLGSLTEIDFLGTNVVYSINSGKECKVTAELYERQHQYLMETGEECSIPVHIDSDEWLEKAKGYLTGWWLMHYLETVMEKYDVHNCS